MTAAGSGSDEASEGGSRATTRYVRAGLELLDLRADEAELAVIGVADSLYRALIQALLEAELDGVEAEPGADMSSAPRRLAQR
jgi:hypothetical protein